VACLEGRAKRGVLLGLPVLVGVPLPFWSRRRWKGKREGEGKGGSRPLP